MTALETLLTKLASDEFDEKVFTREWYREHGFMHSYKDEFRSNVTFQEITRYVARWQHQQSHARMSLLGEMVKMQQKAIKDIRWSWANDFGRACDEIAAEALAKLEAMAKEQT